jgi:DNA mismatch repair protein MutH
VAGESRGSSPGRGKDFLTSQFETHCDIYSASNRGDKKFWEELIAYFLLIRHGSRRKRQTEQFFAEPLPINDMGLHIQTHKTSLIPLSGIIGVNTYSSKERHTESKMMS